MKRAIVRDIYKNKIEIDLALEQLLFKVMINIVVS